MLDTKEPPKPPENAGGVAVGKGGFIQGLVGIAVGAVAGYFVFLGAFERAWVLLPVPGLLIGLCRAVLSQQRSWVLAGIAGVTAFALGIHLHNRVFVGGFSVIGAKDWAGIIAGAAMAFWFARGRSVN